MQKRWKSRGADAGKRWLGPRKAASSCPWSSSNGPEPSVTSTFLPHHMKVYPRVLRGAEHGVELPQQRVEGDLPTGGKGRDHLLLHGSCTAAARHPAGVGPFAAGIGQDLFHGRHVRRLQGLQRPVKWPETYCPKAEKWLQTALNNI